MSFAWEDYLAIANQLVSEADVASHLQEAKYRAAISRAYYAAFKKALWYLEDVRYLRVATRDQHKAVIEEYENSNVKNEQDIGDKLYTLRGKRTKADYYFNFKGNLKTEAYQALRLSQEILDLVASLS